MKKIAILSLVVLGFQSVWAQSADEIIKRYFENTGGVDKWKALTGLRILAKANQQGMEIPIEIVQLKDGRQYTKVTFQGMDIKQGVFDGKTLWSTNFMNMKPERRDAESTENFKQQIGDFPDPFLNYKSLGYKVELVGKETVDGNETFKIKLIKKPIKVDGVPTDNVVFYYFDAQDYVPILIESEIKSGPAKGQISQIKYSDYQDVNGLIFPFSMTQGAKGSPMAFTTTVVKYELNPKVDEALFKYPEGN
ncbi:MAG: outer membrane lipoprotein-sorting protein [Cyclobacteriaceae bacterium]|nr:outer membrane lipoprotein-sorting protein [Cyclobacteriaceae bacterium]